MSMKISGYKKSVIVFCVLLCSILFLSCSNIYFFSLDNPRNIKVHSITSNSAEVSWPPVKKAAYYEVMWQMKDSSDWAYETVRTNHFCIKDLWYDQEYVVQVASFPDEKDSKLYAPSDYVKQSFKTLGDVPPAGELARPGNTRASINNTKTAITVNWDAVQNAAYYDICFEFMNSYSPVVELRVVKTVPVSQTEFVYTEALPGSKVIIKIAARNSDFSDSCRWSKDIILSLQL